MSKTKLKAWIFSAITCVLATPSVLAADWLSQDFMSPYEDAVFLDLGGIVNQFDTSLRIDGTVSAGGRTRGTDINLENNGLRKNLSSFEGGLTWRFAPRHRLHFDYFSVERSGSRTYTTDITIGGNDYPVGATVGITGKYDLGILDYRYSFFQRPDFETALLIGAYGGKVSFDVNASGNAGRLTTAYANSVSTPVPLPVVGASFDWYPMRQVKVSVIAAGLKAEINHVNGRIGLFGVDGNYMLTRNFGLGLRYAYVDVKADVTRSSFDGRFGWSANSFSAYARLAF